jgi:hypothetical protein
MRDRENRGGCSRPGGAVGTLRLSPLAPRACRSGEPGTGAEDHTGCRERRGGKLRQARGGQHAELGINAGGIALLTSVCRLEAAPSFPRKRRPTVPGKSLSLLLCNRTMPAQTAPRTSGAPNFAERRARAGARVMGALDKIGTPARRLRRSPLRGDPRPGPPRHVAAIVLF